MSHPDAGSADHAELGRTAAPWSPVHDWVMISSISPHAKALYAIYKGHVSRTRDDNDVWPGQVTLAMMLGVARRESITKYNRELEAIGAIEIRKERMPRRNVYVIHELPPPNYLGPTTYKEWYERNAEELQARRDAVAEKDARARSRRSSPASPKNAMQASGKKGTHASPKNRVEPKGAKREEAKREELPPTPRGRTGARRAARCRDGGGRDAPQENQKTGTIDSHDLAAAAYVAEPPAATGGILDRLTDRDRQRLVAAIANQLRTGITLKQVTETIADRNFDGVTSIVAALIARINKLEPAAAKPQRRQVPECGQCQSRWVPVLDDEGHERWAPCPTCSPQAIAKAAA